MFFSGIKPWLTRSITRSRPSSWQRPLDQPTPRELPPREGLPVICLLKNLRQTAPRFEDVEAEMLTTYLWDSSRYNLLINCIMNLLLTYNMKQASEQVYDLYIYIHTYILLITYTCVKTHSETRSAEASAADLENFQECQRQATGFFQIRAEMCERRRRLVGVRGTATISTEHSSATPDCWVSQ